MYPAPTRSNSLQRIIKLVTFQALNLGQLGVLASLAMARVRQLDRLPLTSRPQDEMKILF